MAQQHVLKFQTTIPASLTRTPQHALEETIKRAAETLRRMVPNAYDVEFKPVYRERKHKVLGLQWDLNVVMMFNHKGPLPANVQQLVTFYKIQKQLKGGRGN